ncbi:MAG: PIG-L deacetylase family protein [Gemmobacter sp.]
MPCPAGGSIMAETRTALVISAHTADFVWRCGGAIALHAAQGVTVTVVCLSYGEQGGERQALEAARHDARPRQGRAAGRGAQGGRGAGCP